MRQTKVFLLFGSVVLIVSILIKSADAAKNDTVVTDAKVNGTEAAHARVARRGGGGTQKYIH